MTGGPGDAPSGESGRESVDLRPGLERRVRRAWRRGGGGALGAAGALYAIAAEARNFAYEVGAAAPLRPPVPVVSVGGLTVGGSGKTPITASLAGMLGREGREVAVVTHGYADELAVHRRLAPRRIVVGGRDRSRAVARAAAEGAGLALVDSGLQRRRMARSVEVVTVGTADARARGRLPAGPMRESWSVLGRADAVVLTHRAGAPGFPDGFGSWLRRRLYDTPVAACELRPGELVAANRSAREARRPGPAVALASVMHAAPFFQSLEAREIDPPVRVRVSDHGRPPADRLDELVRRAGARGIVGTLKDVVKLRDAVGEATPLWYLEERRAWTRGRAAVCATIERILEETA